MLQLLWEKWSLLKVIALIFIASDSYHTMFGPLLLLILNIRTATWKSGASWPARGSIGSTSREAVNRVCVCKYMLCHAPMMFTCTKVLRPHNSCKGRVKRVKYELLEQKTCCWVVQSKQNRVGNIFKHGEGLSLTPGRGWDGRIREGLQGIAAQVCMDMIQ
jgi:hypothetical protein